MNDISKRLKTIVTSKYYVVAEVMFLVVIPLLLSALFQSLRTVSSFVVVILFVYGIIVYGKSGITRQSLGMTRKNLFHSIGAVSLPTILFLISIVFMVILLPRQADVRLGVWTSIQKIDYRLLIYFVISIPLQEIVYRGFIISRLELITKNRVFIILFSSAIFMLVHLPLGNVYVDIAALLLGVLWAHNFLTYRNLFGLIIIHELIGILFAQFLI